MRIGHGYDVHKLVEGRPLILGGVTIPFEKGLLGHSDADVLLHAISDALLGAAALVLAALARIFVIPRFKYKPGKLQLLLEELVTFFQNLAQTNSPHRNGFLGAYLFGAGVYVLFGTLFELFGLQAVTTAGGSISLPAPLSDINAAISEGCKAYLVLIVGGIAANTLRGAAKKAYYSIPEKARLTKKDIEQGTVTISNLGSLYRGQRGYGTLIEIVPPQVCAFALGAVQDKPVVVTDKFGNKTIEARQILPITVVFDHRALDFGDVIPFLKKMDSIFAHPQVIQAWKGQERVKAVIATEGEGVA